MTYSSSTTIHDELPRRQLPDLYELDIARAVLSSHDAFLKPAVNEIDRAYKAGYAAAGKANNA